jgi:hypothetical protein
MSVLLALASCGGGGSTVEELPLNTDYSTLRLAESRDAPLQYANSDEQMLAPLRNGLRLMTQSSPIPTFFSATTATATGGQVSYSATTVQVEGVDEADVVRYDGRYIYAARRQSDSGASSTVPALSRNVLAIARTDAAAATVQPIANYVLEDQQSVVPQLYQFPGTGQADYIVAVSQDYSGWAVPLMLPIASLVVQPDHTTVQLLDVRDPLNVSQAWKLRVDGWLNASRMIGDTLYLVTSYRPRIPGIILPADTQAKREANERLIRSSTSTQLLPHYTENGGAARSLVLSHGCLIAQQMANNDAYTDLLVVLAVNVRTRRVTDANCLSTNVNGVYMSRNSLYVAGTTSVNTPGTGGTTLTVLHKFAIKDGEMSYRATGSVAGSVGWSNPSYFMDELNGDLRILTSEQLVHRLTVLREAGQTLSKVATLPNASRPAAIGKTGEQVFAVRFVGDRGYIVTFRFTDPLYVIDLHDPADPAIAGQLEIPGVSNYLRAIGSSYLLSVGQEAVNNRRGGVKVELFDVRDITHPQSLGAKVFGNSGSGSEALYDPHALTFLEKPAPDASLRLMLPIDVNDVPNGTGYGWSYSGMHVLEVAGTDTASPQLRLHGLLKTADSSSAAYPPHAFPSRGILHDDAVFAVDGERFLSKRWQDFPPP